MAENESKDFELLRTRDEFTDFELLWMRTCAVYPVLRWPLTCHIGRALAIKLKVPEPDLDAHVPIARHPWFRQGYIPDEIREQLLEGLSADQRELIAGVYRDLLDTDQARKEWKALYRDQKQGALVVPVEDRIFTQFLLGERPASAESALNHRIADRLGSRWLLWLDSRAAVVTLAGLVLSAGLGGGMAALVMNNRVKGEEIGTIALPVMVRLPGGTFQMGSPVSEEDRFEDEGPQRPVTIEPFDIARTEVTVAEFEAFERATGYQRSGPCWIWDAAIRQDREEPDTEQWPGFRQTMADPVVCVSWNDARAYIDWLNMVDSAGGYRLPSEAEWEYAVRAGTTSAYFWGEVADDTPEAACGYANGADEDLRTSSQGSEDWIYTSCSDGGVFTAPVAGYRPNGFGLHDMSGNVWEWVEDCWHDDYTGAPTDGSAWLSEAGGDCSRRVVRGGSWYYFPLFLRSAFRDWFEPVVRFYNLGFRPARTP